MKNIAIVWFRQDLRLKDNPALSYASAFDAVVPLFIWAPHEEQSWPLGGASKWWLNYSLENLMLLLKQKGLQLVIRQGDSLAVLQELVKESKATAILWNRRYEPFSIAIDSKIRNAFQNIEVKSFNGSLLYEPWEIANKQKKPFQVFTPFWKRCLASKKPDEILPCPILKPYPQTISSIELDKLNLLPKIPWDAGIKRTWQPGCTQAEETLRSFVNKHLKDYAQTRDRPDIPNGVSHLSPFLHFGEISPRMIWHAVHKKESAGSPAFLRQLGWREFAYHLLYHFPKTPNEPLKKEFSEFPWEYDSKALKAWQKGLTGYPFVDAGMRQLWQTGWMHNRTRLAAGSFLVKDLRLHWLEGEKWFWDTLVDADLANNCLGWQWVSGCGADAAPYFRIFNPVLQGEKFDPEGIYVRKWVPELAKLPNKWIHRPWEAPSEVLAAAKIQLGKIYPFPIVDHAQARDKALAAFKSLKKDIFNV